MGAPQLPAAFAALAVGAQSLGVGVMSGYPAIAPDTLLMLLVGVPAWIITIGTLLLWLQMRERRRTRLVRRAAWGASGRRSKPKPRIGNN
jgi:hypothetical protein